MASITYSIKRNRLERSYLKGMELDPRTDTLHFDPESSFHRLYVTKLDAAGDDATWGRLSFAASLQETQILYVHAMATNLDTIYDADGTYEIEAFLLDPEYPDEEKRNLLNRNGAERFVGKNDILLYKLSGRYLFLCIEVVGTGEGYIGRLRVDRVGDNFMETFPAVYRQRDSFFHRFLSIFSSIYNDMEHEIDRLPELLDPDTCPVACLPVYASWLGIDLSGDFLSEASMRTFVKEAYQLNRIKGTKRCLTRVLEIVLDEKVVILEQNTIKAYLEKGEMVSDTGLAQASIYDVNILIRKPLSETDRHQLLYLLNQFKPLRSRLHLVQLKDSAILDTDVYLDMNAVLSGDVVGVFDENMEMDDQIVLDE